MSAAAAAKAAWFAGDDRARLAVRGADARDLLHRLATADVASLAPGTGAPAWFLERTGRPVDRALVCALADGSFRLVGGPGRGDALCTWIDRHVIADDAIVESLAGSTALATIAGEGAAAAVAAGLDVATDGLGVGGSIETEADGRPLLVVRGEDVDGVCLHLLGPPAAVEAVHGALPLVPDGDAAEWTRRRVQAGRAAWGAEIDERTIPLELGPDPALDDAVGCWPGQEVVSRLRRGDRTKRALVRGRVAGGIAPRPGTPLRAAGGEADVGRVTSATPPGDEGLVLALVGRASAAPGTRLAWRSDDGADGAVEVLGPAAGAAS